MEDQKENNEIWKDVVGYEGIYIVSNIGNVKSVERICPYRIHRMNGILFKKKEVDRKKTFTGGYFRVNLSKDGKSSFKKVQRLVAMAFIPNPNNYPFVNHINGIKTDNSVENLEWCTPKQNIQHAIRTGLIVRKKGKDNLTSKSVFQLSLDGKIIKRWDNMLSAEIESNFNNAHIGSCCKGRRKTHHGFKWVYA